jgi:hypothetical protein
VNVCAIIREASRLPIFVTVAGPSTIPSVFPHANVLEQTDGKFSFGLRHYAPAPALPQNILDLLARVGVVPLDNPEFFSEP